MKKMERFEVINIASQDDARLTFEGKFNDYAFGSGDSRKAAIQFAIELIQAEGKVEVSKALVKEMETADDTEFGGPVQLAVRFFYDRTEEDAKFDANLTVLIEDSKAKRQALLERGEVPEEEMVPA